MIVYTDFGIAKPGPTSSQIVPERFCSLGAVRHPGDPVYTTTVTLKNIIIGSRYWLVEKDDYSTVLATGIAATSDVVLTNIPAYSTDMLAYLRVRNASGSPQYKTYETQAYITRKPVTIFLFQQVDA